MAALCTGSYGLSQNCTDESKQYFFVKLTDSAYRAIEDYQRNQSKYNTQAKIQISENGGIISFPTSTENAAQQFTFAIDEIEGSLECIQQKQTQLDVLGTLQYKMRIHANEDVYETTRHRMAVAEETQKKKSTVEIKPNQTDIGRKVKLKNSNSRLPNIPAKRDHSLLMNSTVTSQLSQSSLIGSSNSSPSSNLLTNAIGLTTPSPLSPSRVTPTHQYVNSSNLTNSNLGTTTGNNNTAFHSLSSVHSNSSINNTGYLSTENYKNNYNLNNFTTSSTKYLHNNNNSNTNNIRSSSSNENSNSFPTAASSLSSALSSAAGSGTSGINSGYFSSNNNKIVRATSGLSSGNNSLSGNNRKSTMANAGLNRTTKSNSRHNILDIKKRTLRERLIHMLALKNFKKPEIYARLQNEGIREKEKNLVSTILKEISILRDNTFNLKRQIWNEVNEDWPFYTEQDLQILKRRKPQNLTPPLSSDGGSSTSGQSPTSTHNGSPPPAVKRPSIDRNSYYEEPTVKKQRISHFKKDGNDINCSTIANMRHQQDSDENLMGLSYSVLGTEAARRISQRDGLSQLNGQSTNLGHQQVNSNNGHQSYSMNKGSINNNCNSNKNNNITSGINSNINGHTRKQSPSSQHNIGTNNCIDTSSTQHNNKSSNNNHAYASGYNNNNTNNNNNNNNNKGTVMSGDRRKCSSPMNGYLYANNKISSCTPEESVKNVQSDSSPLKTGGSNDTNSISNASIEQDSGINDRQEDCRVNTDSIRPKIENLAAPENDDRFDFSCFKKITSIEQRRKYKTEFGKDYDEYKKLLNEIDSVRTRFNLLAQQLNNARNNDANYRSIKRQIVDEYQRIQNQREHQNVKARFNYLHAKLAHIKMLVNEFDKTLTSTDTACNDESTLSGTNNPSSRRTSVSPSLQNFGGSTGCRSGINNSGVWPNINSSANSNFSGKTATTKTSSPNLQCILAETSSPSFLDITTGSHLPKNENY